MYLNYGEIYALFIFYKFLFHLFHFFICKAEKENIEGATALVSLLPGWKKPRENLSVGSLLEKFKPGHLNWDMAKKAVCMTKAFSRKFKEVT